MANTNLFYTVEFGNNLSICILLKNLTAEIISPVSSNYIQLYICDLTRYSSFLDSAIQHLIISDLITIFPLYKSADSSIKLTALPEYPYETPANPLP